MRQTAFAILALGAATAVLVSCGNNYNNNPIGGTPGANPATIKVHVFISNPLFPNVTSTAPVLNVVDGQRDLLSPAVISVGATSTNPGLMVLFPNKRFTLVFSAANNSLTVVNNASQSVAQNLRRDVGVNYAARLQRKYCCGAGQRHRLCRGSQRNRDRAVSRGG